MDEASRRKNINAINRLFRGEATEWTNAAGMSYRRVWREGREYWEQSYADGGTKSDEITPSLRELFLKLAATDDPDELEKLYREAGIPLPGDARAPRKN